MNVIKLVCPNCKANIELDDSREFGFCQYCGTKILLEKEQPNVVINNTIIITEADSEPDIVKDIVCSCGGMLLVIGSVLFLGIAMKWTESPLYWISIIAILIIIKIIQTVQAIRKKKNK